MKEVWIVNPYGTIPGEAWREYRSTMLAKILEQNGYRVVQWISDFEHRSKKFRKYDSTSLNISEHYTIELINTLPYKAHISLDRIRSEQRYAENFLLKAREREAPACIVLADPALFYSKQVRQYVKQTGTQLIVDIIDIWPELFAISLPRIIRPLHKVIFKPLYRRRAKLLKEAAAIIAVAENYIELAGRICKKNIPKEVIYWGINFEELQSENNIECLPLKAMHAEKGDEIWVLYAGTLGENYDIRTILEVSKKIEQHSDIRLILAGDGPQTETVEQHLAEHCLRRTTFLGRVNPNVLMDIYSKCDVAISSYKGESTVAMPIKAFDYFAGGLPIVNSLGRDLGHFVVHNNVGLQYEAENADSMYEKILALSTDRTKLQRMKENCRNLAIAFDYRKQYQKIIPILANILKHQ